MESQPKMPMGIAIANEEPVINDTCGHRSPDK
jgi:hypothetical protein